MLCVYVENKDYEIKAISKIQTRLLGEKNILSVPKFTANLYNLHKMQYRFTVNSVIFSFRLVLGAGVISLVIILSTVNRNQAVSGTKCLYVFKHRLLA